MAFIPETGAGLPNANSYVALPAANAYFADLANERWAEATDAEKEAALIRATQALNTKYRGKWIGEKLVATQRLPWPRVVTTGGTEALPDPDGGVLPVNAVPQAVIEATCEAALIELDTRFLPQSVSADNAIKSEKVDVIETVYKDGAPMFTTYPHVEAMLEGLIDHAGGGTDMVMRVTLTEREAQYMNGGCGEDYLNDPRYFIQ